MAPKRALVALSAHPWLLAGASLALGFTLALWPYTALGEGLGNLLSVPVRVEQVKAAPPRLTWNDVGWAQNADGDWVVSMRLPQGTMRGEINQEKGQSMQPALGPGHKVLYMPVEQIALGDLVVYENITGMNLHRVVGFGRDEKGWYLEAQGDANWRRDLLRVRREEVKGVVLVVLY